MKKKTKKKKVYNLTSKIRSALRLTWRRSPMQYQHIKAARVGPRQYKCVECGGIQDKNEIHVDHVESFGHLAGKDWHAYIEALFHGEQRVVCRPCHKEITAQQRQARLSQGSGHERNGGS